MISCVVCEVGLSFQLWRGGVVEKGKERKGKERSVVVVVVVVGRLFGAGMPMWTTFSKGIRGGLG